MSIDRLQDIGTDIEAALEMWEAGHDNTARMQLQAAQAKAQLEIAEQLRELNKRIGYIAEQYPIGVIT